MANPKVLLVDDHAIVRSGVRTLLERDGGFDVVGEAASGQEAVGQAGRLKPDFVLLDITLPDINGLEAMARIKEVAPGARVVILTMHEDKDYFFRAMHAGADGYVVKGAAVDHIPAALHAVQDGGVYVYPSLAKAMVADYIREPGDPVVRSLSDREVEVLRLMGEGLTNSEIASRLGVSNATAQTYRTRIMEKLGLHTVAELVRYGIRKGIIRP